jgi:hypothetical protein
MHQRWFGLLLAIYLLVNATQTEAVVLYRTPTRNMSAPTGTLYNSGWQWEGKWGPFLGTPIGPNHFITAGHVGGAVGQTFTYNYKPYAAVAMYDDPRSDLRIWKVNGTFPSYAPLYTLPWETGKPMVVVGRGAQRGGEVWVNGQLKGWKQGYSDSIQSWGENVVNATVDGGSGSGSLLRFTFSRVGGVYNESILSPGDSGGGVYIKDGTTWKLAGINKSVEGFFSYNGAWNSGFNASLFDAGGLYYGGNGNWKLISDLAGDIQPSSYATRISSNVPWIRSVLSNGISPTSFASSSTSNAVPEPGSIAIMLIGAAALLRCRPRRF